MKAFNDFVSTPHGDSVSYQDDVDADKCLISDLSIRLAKDRIDIFPTTRYYGSKKRLLHWIYENLKDIPFKTVLDGFGGTASVSLLFKAMGKQVTFNDALQSNGISARAMLANHAPFDDEQEVHDFFYAVKPVNGFIAETFAGKFYLNDENSWLDGVVLAIETQPEDKKNALFYSLFQACLQKRPFNLFHRANLSLRTNGVGQQSFGNQTTWDTPFPALATRAYKELARSNWASKLPQTILPPTDINNITGGYDLIYLDPPYINLKNTGDDYLRRYHFLEGLCQYDDWHNLIDHSYNNLQMKKRNHITEWQSKRCFKDNLYGLIEKHRHSIVVLSYVAGAYPSENELVGFFKQSFKTMRVAHMDIPHALSQGKKNELIIVGIPS